MSDALLQASLARAEALDDIGRHEEALRELAPWLAAHPDDPSLQVLAAHILLDIDGGLERSLEHARRAAALLPGAARPLMLQALALTQLGRREEAYEVALAAVKQAPWLAHAHLVLGHACLGVYRLNPVARRAADEAIRLSPQEPDGHLLAAQARVITGYQEVPREDVEAANRHVGEALRLAPNDPRVHTVRGLVAHVGDDVDSAVHGYLAAARLDPQGRQAKSGLTEALVKVLHQVMFALGGCLFVIGRALLAAKDTRATAPLAVFAGFIALGAVAWGAYRIRTLLGSALQGTVRHLRRSERLVLVFAALLMVAACAMIVAVAAPYGVPRTLALAGFWVAVGSLLLAFGAARLRVILD